MTMPRTAGQSAITRRATVRLMVVFLCFLVVSCARLGKSEEDASLRANDLVGTWVLETVGGDPPATINIKSWRIVFSANHQWTYSGEMTGRFAGMQLNGSGAWEISSGVLEYTAGANKGRSTPTIRQRILTLSPDPVVMPDGKKPAVTTYKTKHGVTGKWRRRLAGLPVAQNPDPPPGSSPTESARRATYGAFSIDLFHTLA
jgi:hypothetical protein